jgi:hypothetical protein
VYEEHGVKQGQEWLGHSDPATTQRHYVRLTTAAREKAVAGLDEVTRAALEAAEERAARDAEPAPGNVVSLAGRRRQLPFEVAGWRRLVSRAVALGGGPGFVPARQTPLTLTRPRGMKGFACRRD